MAVAEIPFLSVFEILRVSAFWSLARRKIPFMSEKPNQLRNVIPFMNEKPNSLRNGIIFLSEVAF